MDAHEQPERPFQFTAFDEHGGNRAFDFRLHFCALVADEKFIAFYS